MPNLGRKYDRPSLEAEPMKEPEISYPSLYVDECKEDLKLPESGEAVIKFKVRRKTERTKKGGEKKYSYDIDVISLDVKNDKKPAKKFTKDTDEALDEIKEALMGDEG